MESYKVVNEIDGHQIGSLDGEVVVLRADHEQALAEQRATIERLQEALQLLYDVQNGCPLPKYQTDWDRAMVLTQQALKELFSFCRLCRTVILWRP